MQSKSAFITNDLTNTEKKLRSSGRNILSSFLVKFEDVENQIPFLFITDKELIFVISDVESEVSIRNIIDAKFDSNRIIITDNTNETISFSILEISKDFDKVSHTYTQKLFNAIESAIQRSHFAAEELEFLPDQLSNEEIYSNTAKLFIASLSIAIIGIFVHSASVVVGWIVLLCGILSAIITLIFFMFKKKLF